MAPPRDQQRRLLLDTCVLGVAGALAAQLFGLLLRLCNSLFLGILARYTPPGAPNEGGALREIIGPYGLWLLPLSTTLGGLIVGLLVERLAPEAEGHGTGAVVNSFHHADGYLRDRVGPVKLVASAITIGSGGSAGREGPVALITAGLASTYSRLMHRGDVARRQLLLVGAAAGLAAIFRSPVGTALFAIEVLYSDMEFETGVLLYTMLASIVAYAVNGLFVGYEPLFRVPQRIELAGPLDTLAYVLLGLCAGVLAALLPTIFYRVRDAFRWLPIRRFLKPAIGGLLVGLMALWLPEVIGGGYGWMQLAINGSLSLRLLLVLVAAKMVSMSLTISSGGSGGVFAPTLFVGAMFGAALAHMLHQPAAPFAIVGMAALFAGAAHVPIATLMMVTEMTGGYTLLVPAALAVMLSYLVQTRLTAGLRYPSLYEAQVPSRADSPAHHTEQLAAALRILKEHGDAAAGLSRADLLPLLRLGVPLQLKDGRRLITGIVREDTPLAGHVVENPDAPLAPDTRLIALLRGEHMIMPAPGTRISAGDRIVLLAGGPATDALATTLDPW